jgi:hypothetical protein
VQIAARHKPLINALVGTLTQCSDLTVQGPVFVVKEVLGCSLQVSTSLSTERKIGPAVSNERGYCPVEAPRRRLGL